MLLRVTQPPLSACLFAVGEYCPVGSQEDTLLSLSACDLKNVAINNQSSTQADGSSSGPEPSLMSGSCSGVKLCPGGSYCAWQWGTLLLTRVVVTGERLSQCVRTQSHRDGPCRKQRSSPTHTVYPYVGCSTL